MTHEILFRGKRLNNGKWVYGYPFISNTDGSAYILRGSREFTHGYRVYPDTLKPYTGMSDKNGVKIFEGDIVCTVYDGIENVFVVVWDNDELDFKATNGKENYGPGGFQYMPCCEEVKILGNVHDNPELLEVQNETY